MQQQLNQHLQAQKAMQNEINYLRGQVQAMNAMNSSILTNVRWAMVQNRAIMRKLEISINVNVEQHFPNAQDPIQPPNIDLVETGVWLGISPSPAVTTPPTVAAATNPPVAAATPPCTGSSGSKYNGKRNGKRRGINTPTNYQYSKTNGC